MAEREAIERFLEGEWKITLAGAKRDRQANLTADVALSNGAVRHLERVNLSSEEARRAWAMAAAPETGPRAEELEGTLRDMILDVVTVLQDMGQGQDIDALLEDVELFHYLDDAYARIRIRDHEEVMLVAGRGFKRWLARRYYEETGRTLRAQVLADTVCMLEGRAIHDGVEEPVYTRVAWHGNDIIIDLGDPDWHVVRVSPRGWTVESSSPVAFRRPRGLGSLPTPARDGNLADLRTFVNVATDEDLMMVVTWLVAALRPGRPYAVLVLRGERGSAKSTTGRVLRRLVDPNAAPLRSRPRNEQDVFIAARNGHLVALDNLSDVPDRLSDALCMVASGGGYSTRKLWSDDDEALLQVMCPVLLIGIDDLVTREDLLDRSIFVDIPHIPKEHRRSEEEVWEAFDQVGPALFGALLDALSTALRNLPQTDLREQSRMADFERWVVAAEPSLPWRANGFLRAYRANQATANQNNMDASSVATSIRTLERLARRLSQLTY